jgi:hypothetical protein
MIVLDEQRQGVHLEEAMGWVSTKAQQEKVSAPDENSAPPAEVDNELEQKLAQLRDAVSNSRVPEARAMVKELEARWPESDRVRYWARVLAPPVVVPTKGPDPRSHPRDRERAWLQEHGHEYSGC